MMSKLARRSFGGATVIFRPIPADSRAAKCHLVSHHTRMRCQPTTICPHHSSSLQGRHGGASVAPRSHGPQLGQMSRGGMCPTSTAGRIRFRRRSAMRIALRMVGIRTSNSTHWIVIGFLIHPPPQAVTGAVAVEEVASLRVPRTAPSSREKYRCCADSAITICWAIRQDGSLFCSTTTSARRWPTRSREVKRCGLLPAELCGLLFGGRTWLWSPQAWPLEWGPSAS